MLYEVTEDKLQAGDFRVEAIGADGEVYQAIFVGPDAQQRAEHYAEAENVGVGYGMRRIENKINLLLLHAGTDPLLEAVGDGTALALRRKKQITANTNED